MHLGFSNKLGKLVVKYVPTYTKGTLRKKSALPNDAYGMFLWAFFLLIFFFFFIEAYVVGTQLNSIDVSMQFKWVSTTYAFIKM